MAEDWLETNRDLWDERVPIHVASSLYGVDAFVAGSSSLRAFELAELPDVRCRTLVHPQCHFGEDTLSWARLGAHVTGVDFSAPAVAAARELAGRCGLAAEFAVANVYDCAAALGGRTFDIVYTGLGALNWLPDIGRWAATMAAVCRPGGTLYVTEFHPVVSMLSADLPADDAYPPHLQQNYFGHYWHEGPDVTGTYADPSAQTEHNETWERVWTVGEVVTAIAAAGFHIESLEEHDHTLYPAFPYLEPHDDGTYRMPAGSPSMPMMYSVLATHRA
jgi:SAM-dependent methyltransferase